MKLVEKIINKLGFKTKNQKNKRIAFEVFKINNFNNVYNRTLQFAKDDELTRNGLLLNEQQLKPLVYKMIQKAIEDGVLHPTTFEMCNSLEIICN